MTKYLNKTSILACNFRAFSPWDQLFLAYGKIRSLAENHTRAKLLDSMQPERRVWGGGGRRDMPSCGISLLTTFSEEDLVSYPYSNSSISNSWSIRFPKVHQLSTKPSRCEPWGNISGSKYTTNKSINMNKIPFLIHTHTLFLSSGNRKMSLKESILKG